jgi:hypothetical protein
MTSFFLKLRHWQLFLMLLLPTVLCFLFKISFERLVVAGIVLFTIGILFFWMYSITSWSNRYLSQSRKKNLIPYTVGLLLPAIEVLLVIILYFPTLKTDTPTAPPVWLGPLHIVAMIGVFYCLWFTARQFKSLMEKENADFINLGNLLFLFWIFPLGIWIIQPNVNLLYHRLAATNGAEDEDR